MQILLEQPPGQPWQITALPTTDEEKHAGQIKTVEIAMIMLQLATDLLVRTLAEPEPEPEAKQGSLIQIPTNPAQVLRDMKPN